MKIIARPHATPEPPEPVAELYLHKINDTAFVYADKHDGKPHEAVVEIEHDGERFVVTARAHTLATAEPPRSFLEAMRPVIDALVTMKTSCRNNGLYGARAAQIDAAIAAFESADSGRPGPLERAVFEPKQIQIRMVHKPPDRPGLWLRKRGDCYETYQVREKNGRLVCEGDYAVSSYAGPWSEKPLEISE